MKYRLRVMQPFPQLSYLPPTFLTKIDKSKNPLIPPISLFIPAYRQKTFPNPLISFAFPKLLQNSGYQIGCHFGPLWATFEPKTQKPVV